MGQLIDDLLDFSRVGRKEIVKIRLNMDSMVRSTFHEMAELEKDREICGQINMLDSCEADPNLLRQVWVNLISNAVKYTRKKEKAIIEITSTRNNDETVYRIKDNGTGFDMQYVHKLFGVFQRLHRQQDFEGTGVGLAIVHRIITRHGGKVWAEGKVDEGSAFYFTLPNETNTSPYGQ
jgi:light-regulated signal transduction histidine kinase (bacteriophytochrome)